jgi:hypothetical protein
MAGKREHCSQQSGSQMEFGVDGRIPEQTTVVAPKGFDEQRDYRSQTEVFRATQASGMHGFTSYQQRIGSRFYYKGSANSSDSRNL